MTTVVRVEKEERIKCEECVAPRPQYVIAASAFRLVAIHAEISVRVPPEGGRERDKSKAAHCEPVNQAIHDCFVGEDAVAHWWSIHDVWCAAIKRETNGRTGSSRRVDEQNSYRAV